jgi:hypothetical protein
MTTAKTPPGVWVGQPLHFACLVSLLALLFHSFRRPLSDTAQDT